MKLYNCFYEEEKKLEEIELQELDNEELVKLARDIKTDFAQLILQDETIVIDALVQIAEELGRRVK